MTRIACLGWGSLVWNPKNLPLQSEWHTDGPLVRIEFLRQSQDNRITLVLHETANTIQTSWALMRTNGLKDSIEALRIREGMPTSKRVGFWEVGASEHPCIENLNDWATVNCIDAVVWTNLPPKFSGTENRIPSVEEVITHLKKLNGEEKQRAEEYIRKAPKQTNTSYRRRIEADLGWLPD